MQDLVGKAFGEVWGLNTMAPTYKIDAYYTWGLAGGDSNENRPKGHKHKIRKSQTHQQEAFPKRPSQNHGGRTCRKEPPPQQTQPHTHTPRLIIQSVLCENRNGKQRGTNTSQSNHTPCEVCIFKANFGHTEANTFKVKWNFAFK